MPLSLSIDKDILTLSLKGVNAALTQAQKDAQFAARATVTQIANEGRVALNNALKNKLDRPVPFIYKAYFYQRATSLEKPVARILVGGGFTAGSKADYIESITETGKHIPGRLTKRFRRSGLLRSGESLVATRKFKRNSKGNISGAKVVRLLYKGVVLNEGGWRGVYERRGRKIVKMLTPARVGDYRRKPLVDVDKVLAPVLKTFEVKFDANYKKALTRSIAKALR